MLSPRPNQAGTTEGRWREIDKFIHFGSCFPPGSGAAMPLNVIRRSNTHAAACGRKAVTDSTHGRFQWHWRWGWPSTRRQLSAKRPTLSRPIRARARPRLVDARQGSSIAGSRGLRRAGRSTAVRQAEPPPGRRAPGRRHRQRTRARPPGRRPSGRSGIAGSCGQHRAIDRRSQRQLGAEPLA